MTYRPSHRRTFLASIPVLPMDDENEDWLKDKEADASPLAERYFAARLDRLFPLVARGRPGSRTDEAALLEDLRLVYAARPTSRWTRWLQMFHEGGNRQVPNPNPRTRTVWPTITFNRALRTPSFMAKALEEFKQWNAETGGNPENTGAPVPGRVPTPRGPRRRNNPEAPPTPTPPEGVSVDTPPTPTPAPPTPPRGRRRREPPPPPPKPMGRPLAQGESSNNPRVDLRIGSLNGPIMDSLFGDRPPTVESLTNIYDLPDHDTIVQVFTYGPTLRIHCVVKDKNGHKVGEIIRTYKKVRGKLIVHHDLLRLDEGTKGNGLGSTFLKKSFDAYREMGVTEAEQLCAWDGRYVWARMGYKMSPKHFKKAKEHIKKILYSVLKPEWSEKGAAIRAIDAWVEKNVTTSQNIADLVLPNGRTIGKEALLSFDLYDARVKIKDGDPNYERMMKYLGGDKSKTPLTFDMPLEAPLHPGTEEDWGEEYKVAASLPKEKDEEGDPWYDENAPDPYEGMDPKKAPPDDAAADFMALVDSGPVLQMPPLRDILRGV